MPGDSSPEDDVEVTPEMIAAGVSVLYELEGEVSKSTLARQLYLAMAALQPPHALQDKS